VVRSRTLEKDLDKMTVPLSAVAVRDPPITNPYNGAPSVPLRVQTRRYVFFGNEGGDDPTTNNKRRRHHLPLQQLQHDLDPFRCPLQLITTKQFNDMHSLLTRVYLSWRHVHRWIISDRGWGQLCDQSLPRIMASKAYKENGMIVIWTDETGRERTKTISPLPD